MTTAKGQTMWNRIVLSLVWTMLIVGCGQKPASSSTAKSSEKELPTAVASGEKAAEATPSADDDAAATKKSPVSEKTDVQTPQIPVVSATENSTTTDASQAIAATPQQADAPAESKESKGEPLDMTAQYRTPAANFDQIKTYPWRDAPRGSQTFGNVPLEIGGMICLWGGRNAQGGLVFPSYVEGIPVQRKFETIYLYHATFNNAEDGTPVSNLVFNFDDESHSAFEICCGVHLKDWLVNVNNSTELSDPKSKLVVRRKSSMSTDDAPRELRFYITEIANPQPSSVVTTIDIVSAKEKSSYCILAITTGPAGLLKMDSPPKTE